MRIVSDFKDYYDSASGFGVDTSIVYTRMTKHPQCEEDGAEVSKDILAACSHITHQDRFFNIDQRAGSSVIYVGVAGKIYVGLGFVVNSEVPTPELFPRKWGDVHHTKQIYAWSAGDLTKEQLAEESTFFPRSYEAATVGEWFSKNVDNRAVENLELFTKHNLTTFLVVDSRHGRAITLNPCLKDVMFQRVMDSYTTFQEISMHVSGVLAQKDQMTHTPTDKELLYARGHDDMSFKRAPTKKR